MARKTLAETLSRVAAPDRPRGTALRTISVRLAAVSAVALLAANCSTNPQKLAAGPGAGNGIDPKYGVRASPRLYNEGDVIPKGGGRRFSGKPYVVAGRTYVPREDARGYVREGMASWYGAAFHGRQTANGEVFDRHAVVAAHPTLPLPSYARVTNTTNGRSMVVRVNDRGPYHADRVMDVSEEVAQALEFHRKGTTHVRVEYIGKASVAGSDDRKLMATLRTDGRPAGLRGGSVMLADLGPSEEPEALARDLAKPARAPLAFKPAPEREAEEPRPRRAARAGPRRPRLGRRAARAPADRAARGRLQAGRGGRAEPRPRRPARGQGAPEGRGEGTGEGPAQCPARGGGTRPARRRDGGTGQGRREGRVRREARDDPPRGRAPRCQAPGRGAPGGQARGGQVRCSRGPGEAGPRRRQALRGRRQGSGRPGQGAGRRQAPPRRRVAAIY